MQYSKQDLQRISGCLCRITQSQSLQDRHHPTTIGDLLAQWANNSPTSRRHFNTALAAGAGKKWVRAHSKALTQAITHRILPPQGACEVLLELQAPMSKGFRVLSKYASSLDIPPWARPICTHSAFHDKLKELLLPLALEPAVRAGSHSGVSWPISSWVDYIESRPALRDAIDFAGPTEMPGLHLIIRGDGYPVAGGSFCHLSIALANHGPNARRPAMVWPIGLATCPDSKMQDLGVMWANNIAVCASKGTGRSVRIPLIISLELV